MGKKKGKSEKYKKRTNEGSTILTAPACFAVASAFLKGLRAKEGLYLRVSSLSCRFVSLLAGGACTLPDQKGFVSFVRIGGGACTLPVQEGFVSFVVVSLWWLFSLLPLMIVTQGHLPWGVTTKT